MTTFNRQESIILFLFDLTIHFQSSVLSPVIFHSDDVWGRRGYHHRVVGFITTYAIVAYYH